jgi:FtsK/SpoIIIE family
MSILDERLINRLKNLERWLPPHQPFPAPRRSLARRSRPRPQPANSPAAASAKPDDGLLITPLCQPSLAEALAGLSASDLPDHAALLGLCEDGLPFLLDLANPAPGAILIVADPHSGKTSLLRSILASAVRMSAPESVAFNIIAVQPDEYSSLKAAPHCQSVYPVEDPAVGDLIADLVTTIEARKRRGPADPALILVIDDLAALPPFLDEQAYNRLYWLIRHGPRYQVWTIASLPSPQIEQVDPRFLTAFRTRLFGYMSNERLAHHLASDAALTPRILEQGRQFLIPYTGEWMRFWICEPGQDGLSAEIDLDKEGAKP